MSGSADPTHPFGYYLFLKLWSTLSINLQWLRLSTAVFFVLNCILLHAIGLKSKVANFHHLLVGLYATSGYFLIFDWQARMYTGVVTLMLLSWYAFLTKRPRLFLLANLVGLYFDYSFFWYVLPLTLFLFYRYFTGKKETLLRGMVLSWLGFSLWIPIFMQRYKKGIEGIAWAQTFTRPAFAIPYLLGTHNSLSLTILLVIAALVGAYVALAKIKNFSAQFFIIGGLSSACISLVVSMLLAPIFHVRNLQIVGLSLLFSLATTVVWLWKNDHRHWVALFLVFYFINFLLVAKLHYSLPGFLLVRFL